MGVKGLWRLLSNCGTPVSLESLENKILAIDVSIWLHQAVRGFKGFGSGSVANAHLLTLFHRICKLLFYRIRPVFVFDGGVPQLKRQTLSSRRLRREAAAGKAQKVRDRLLSNLLRSHAVRNALGKKGPAPIIHRVSKPVKKDKDLFELPPLSKPLSEKMVKTSTEIDSEEEEDFTYNDLSHKNLHNFEYDSKEFQSLPLETQHEVLSELHSTRKENSWHSLNEMPQESNSFSSFQMNRLLKRYQFQKNLDGIRTEIKKINTAEIEAQLFGDLEKHVSLTHKIVSEDSTHSILVKNIKEPTSQGIQIEHPTIEKSNKLDIKQDFLTELAKQGIVSYDYNKNGKRDFDSSFSMSSDDDSLSEEDFPTSSNKKKKLEEVAFIKAVDYVLDDSELTQDEILSIIKQTQMEVESESVNSDIKNNVSTKKKGDLSTPSTSANAPGMAYTSEYEESSTDDDFIDVSDQESESVDIKCISSPDQEAKSSPQKQILETNNSNIDKILSAKTDSLYIKIIQQRLDDVVQTTNTKSLVDTRKPGQESNLNKNLSKSPNKRNVTISLSFESAPRQSLEDDIFSDVFHRKELKIVTETLSQDETNSEILKANSNNSSANSHFDLEKEKELTSLLNEPNFDIRNINITDQLKEKVSELVRKEVENIIKNSSIENVSINKEIQENNSLSETKVNNFIMNPNTPLLDKKTDEEILDKNIEKSESKNTVDEIVSSTYSTISDNDSSNEIKLTDSQNGSNNDNKTSSFRNKELERLENIETVDKEIDFTELPAVVPLKYTVDDLKHMENELVNEQTNLITEIHQAERVAVDISDQVYGEAQELLKIFGLPYLVAPMEAEAQCAFLDIAGLTHGSITNDSDIFLFGGKRVYKNFFNQEKHVECFTLDNIKHNMGIDRNKMITLALLTGSDYSIGIESVGAVLGMEILSEFPGSGIECLKNLKKWWNVASKNVCNIQASKTKQRLSRLYLPEFFPNENIFNAYIQPDVDESLEKFSWGVPKVEDLRSFTADKFGWNMLKTDEIIMPVFKKLGVKTTQTRIDSYFNNIKLVKEPHNKSKRLKDAIDRAREESGVSLDDNPIQNSSIERKSSKRTLLMDPSEGNYGIPAKKKRGRKKEKLSSKEDKSTNDTSVVTSQSIEEARETAEAPLSKEEKKEQIYKKLLEKEKITQLENEKMEKRRKRALAVQILSKSKTKK